MYEPCTCLLGIDTLFFLFCLLCYSLILPKCAYYAPEHSYYSQEGTYYSYSYINSWQPLGGLSHSVLNKHIQNKRFNVNIIYIIYKTYDSGHVTRQITYVVYIVHINIVSSMTNKSRNPRAHCTCALRVVLAEGCLCIIPKFLPIILTLFSIPRCTYYAQNYAGIMYQCLLSALCNYNVHVLCNSTFTELLIFNRVCRIVMPTHNCR